VNLNADQREFVNEQLRTRQFVEVLHESRVQSEIGQWRLRDQLHADEVAREQRILDALPKSDKLLVVALDAASGGYSALELLNPIPALDFQGGTHGPADPKIVAEQLAAENARQTHLAHNWANSAIELIALGQIKHFDDLRASAPSNMNFDTGKALLAQASKPRIELRSRQGVVQLGGRELEVRKLQHRAAHRVLVDVRGIDDDGKPNGSIQFKVDLQRLVDPNAPNELRSSEKLKASLETASDARSLAVLHYAKFCQAPVELELALTYLIAERRTELTITRIVNESAILSSTQRASDLIELLF